MTFSKQSFRKTFPFMFSSKPNSTECVGLVWFLQLNNETKTQAITSKVLERSQQHIFDTFNDQPSGNGTRKYIVSINNNICLNINSVEMSFISALNLAKINENNKKYNHKKQYV